MPDEPTNNPNPEPPSSPKIVKKTPSFKTPREIELEKSLSRLEDRIGTLESVTGGINSFLAEAFPTAAAVRKPKTEVAPRQSGGLFEELDQMLSGGD